MIDEETKVIQDELAKTLKMRHPDLYRTIEELIHAGQGAEQVDRHIGSEHGWMVGQIIREMCYSAAKSIERQLKANQTHEHKNAA